MNSKPRADRGAENQFVEISKPRAEEGRNISVFERFESRAEEYANHKIHQKILNLARNKGRIPGIIVVEKLE